MMFFSPLCWRVAAAACLVSACGARAPPAAPATQSASPAQQLGTLVEDYWSDNAALLPWYAWGTVGLQFGSAPGESIAPQALADSLGLEQRYLAAALAVPRAALPAQAKLTYDIFVRERSLAVESFTYPLELLPLNPYAGMAVEFALMAPSAERLALSSPKDYGEWRARTESFVRWTRQAIDNMRDGVRRGYVMPRVVVEQTVPLLAALGADTPANPFYQAVIATPGTAADAERGRTTAAAAVVRDSILPSYRALHDFMQSEYLPRSRMTVSLSALPLGDAWYASLLKRFAGGAKPTQLHGDSTTDVQRLRRDAQALMAQAGFAGDLRAFAQRPGGVDDLESAYGDLNGKAAAAVTTAFGPLPRAEFAVKVAAAYRRPWMPSLSYRARAPNGLMPAILFIRPPAEPARAPIVTADFLRAAIPGHHLQLELQHERAELPRFRRFGAEPAFVEGWALYAATLGEELGLYPQADDKFGALAAQLTCAAGVVIDTGLHSQGWTRQQALEFLQTETALEDADAQRLVDRAIALPAEASACWVGWHTMQALRALSQQTLGARFDLAAFDEELLRNGAMPLDLLEEHIKEWLATRSEAAGESG